VASAVYSPLAARYTPSAVNLARASISFVLFAAWVVIEAFLVGRGLEVFAGLTAGRAGWLVLSIVGGLGLADAFFWLSTRSLGVPIAMALASTYPLWSALFGWAFLGQALDPMQVAGLILVVGGVVYLILLTGRSRSGAVGLEVIPRPRRLAGLGFALLTSLMWAIGAFAMAKGAVDVASPVANTVRMGAGVVLCLCLGLFLKTPERALALPWFAVRANLPILILEGFGSVWAYLYCLTHGPLAVGAALSSLSPLVAALLVGIRGRERVDGAQWVAIIVTTAGILALTLFSS
jgi:drug/metabolite transporter (DMT)-like permease